jgi:uncharacterized protein (TIGR02453 family)
MFEPADGKRMAMAQFKGFSAEGLAFLTQLGVQDKAWMDEHRSTYVNEIAEPAKAFVDALGPVLQETISADIQFVPRVNGSIAPINNDIRFSPEASPYKEHLLMKFWEGPDKKIAPLLYVRLSEDSVGFASGVMFSDLEKWRNVVDDSKTGSELAAILEQLNKKIKDLDIAGQALKRVPKPYDPEHPRGDLLRHKSLQLRWPEPTPKSASTARFVDWTARRLQTVAPLHKWFVRNL